MKPTYAMMTKMNVFFSPNKIIFGNGAVVQVGEEAKKFGCVTIDDNKKIIDFIQDQQMT